jgi:hypothetical protein
MRIAEFASWCLLRAFCIKCSLREAISRAYISKEGELPDFAKAQDPEALLDIAKDVRDKSDKRRAAVLDKCKTLLTVSALLVPLILAVSTQVRYPALFWINGSRLLR